jgi:hypothetical protein
MKANNHGTIGQGTDKILELLAQGIRRYSIRWRLFYILKWIVIIVRIILFILAKVFPLLVLFFLSLLFHQDISSLDNDLFGNGHSLFATGNIVRDIGQVRFVGELYNTV